MSQPRVPTAVASRVHAAARNRCGYCPSPQHLVMARLEIEHIIPRAKGGIESVPSFKGLTALFSPMSKEGRVVGGSNCPRQ